MLIFILRFIYNLLVYLLITLPLELIGIPLLAVTILFLPKEETHLPYLLRWYDTWDEDDGINGSKSYQSENGISYLSRFNWTALRNPLNTFQYSVLGIKAVEHTTNPVDIDATGGFVHNETEAGYYEYYYVKPYKLFGTLRCFRFRMGWKLSGRSHKDRLQWCFLISPFTSFE